MSPVDGAGRPTHPAPPAHEPRQAASPGGAVTELRGPAEDLQGELYGDAAASRPAAEGFESEQDVAAAVAGARETMVVHSGAGVGGGTTVDTDGMRATCGDLSRVASECREVAATLTPLAVEAQLWALTGEPLLGDAAVVSGLLVTGVLDHAAEVSHTARKLEVAAQRYEAAERTITGAFSAEQLKAPWPGAGVAFLRDMARSVEDLEVAFTRAGIDSPEAFWDDVRFTGFGLLVRGGGPHGTDAIVRGPGLDDLLDGALQLPWPDGAAAGSGATAEDGAAEGASGAAAGPAASATGRRPTIGEQLRNIAVERLSTAGRRVTEGSLAEEPPAADGADISELEVAVAAMTMAVPGAAGVYALYREGRRLNPAERTGAALGGVVRNLEEDHPLYPARREVFTGVTPRTAREHHMTPLPRRPLPAGVRHDGAVPTTVAGTAAALKDAKNIVSGADASGESVENSTVMVQKATGADGRSAYSVVLTGTEQWSDGPGVHDLKGIGQGMTASPTDSLTELPQAQRMALQALQDAGIRPGDTVVLTGHSLGGIDAAGLAANQEFRSRYDVQAVTTYGAPVGDFAIPAETSVMAVEHVDDLVPTLDGVPNPDGGRRSTVRVNTPYAGAVGYKGGPLGTAAHEMNLYVVGAQGISGSGNPTVEAHERQLAAAVPHGPGVRTETYVYAGWEEHVGLEGERVQGGGAPPAR
ncbi:lipase family protein [Kocuria sp. KSNUG]|uniref:lipase family protein n=1 Tax=Kocuria sp. KSNUG TaxID=3136676 RepID=UPI003C2E6E27